VPAKGRDVLAAVTSLDVLLVALTVAAAVAVAVQVLRLLRLDIWETLLFLGLAERELPRLPARERRR
jgi:hypothetical protein